METQQVSTRSKIITAGPLGLGAAAVGLTLAFAPDLVGAQDGATNPEVTTQSETPPLGTPGLDRPESFAELAQIVSPAVVNITTTTMVAGGTMPEGMVPEGSPFEDFFRDFQDRGGQAPRRSQALGSGFVISSDGYVVTNNHVIEGADEIEIEFFSGDTRPAELVGTDPNTDIAVLKVDADDMPYVEFGNSDDANAEVGDWVMAMGNPLGQGFSISAGIISARNRALSGTYDDFIQTDAAINRGNSGGPLFNMNGEVIGVNTAILSPNGGSIGIGFSMASNVVTRVVDQLIEFGETRRGWLGVHIQDITPDMVDAIVGIDSTEGALVTDVPEGPAAEAGVMAGDIILSFDGNAVESTRELVNIVGNSAVGEAVDVEVLRNGEMETLSVTLGRREGNVDVMPASQEGEPEAPQSEEVMGLDLSEITPELSEEYGLGDISGLLVTNVDPVSDAAEKGILPGDVITEAGQQPVASIDDLTTRIEEARDAGRRSLLLLIRRDGDPRFVAVVIDDAEE
ncbi:Do family serine endopeptidase [Pseudoroseicyclus tamaricis]|uniref:Do family serine endopeptidase n=1 Tax=Pseudoroseicyclus tamaricis TaxID=2705421 RepID=A0A6B2JG95_9RHOB|nr:Do family serine endopeptidase [Pseudoroseicyclus tamaricis]